MFFIVICVNFCGFNIPVAYASLANGLWFRYFACGRREFRMRCERMVIYQGLKG